MTLPASHLAKLTSPHGEFVLDGASGHHVYHVTNQHGFVQAAGYLKHVHGAALKGGVYYRGQQQLHPTMTPTLYRGVVTQKVKQQRDAALSDYLSRVEADKAVLRAVKSYAREPLLQHYGLRTRWLDLVDNVWVALWFACHEIKSVGPFHQYLHFERRKASADSFAYVILIQSDGWNQDPATPGLFKGELTETIDLRTAVPSQFVRPHAQHALLMRRHKGMDANATDYSQFAVGTIRVPLTDALEWLGTGTLLSVHSLFPPPTYDFGFRELLGGAPPGNDHVASIHHVGA